MKIVLVGGGASNIFLALQLIHTEHEIHMYEKTKRPGKKFLVAGKSDLNITHSENIDSFSKKYFEHKDIFYTLFKEFSNTDLINWLSSEGIETFIGSSKRIFPKDIKASQILKNWMDKLKSHSRFYLHTDKTLTSIHHEYVIFNEDEQVHFDKIIYALGGASWKNTGSDGKWSILFNQHEIHTQPFFPLNCGFHINWSSSFIKENNLKPLKNICLYFQDQKVRGELMVTEYGLEGTPLYSLSYPIMEKIDQKPVQIMIDLKPDLTLEKVKKKLNQRSKKNSLSTHLKKHLNLDKISIALLKELTTKDEFQNELAKKIKSLPINIIKARPMDEAISTGGGIEMDELNSDFELKKLPHHYCIGEMLNWNTITGGYLLQGCFSQAAKIYRVITSG